MRGQQAVSTDIERELAEARESFNLDGPEIGARLFDELLARHPDCRDEILRERSYKFLGCEMFEEALNDLRAIIDSGSGELGDYHLAGEYALEAGRLSLARDMLDQTIKDSIRRSSTYYLGTSRLLAALASLHLNEDGRCLEYLRLIDDEEDVQVTWLTNYDRTAKKSLLEAIEKNAKTGSGLDTKRGHNEAPPVSRTFVNPGRLVTL